MKPAEKRKLIQAVQSYLQIKELTAAQEKQMDELKAIIITIAEANPTAFKEGELLIDGAGLLKYVSSPAKLVFAKTGKTLNEIETMGLVKDLGAKFGKQGLDMSRLKISVSSQDRDVMAVLLNYGVELVQNQRLDIKPIK